MLRRFRVGGGRDGDDAAQFHRTRDAMRIRGVERRGRRADERGVRGNGSRGAGVGSGERRARSEAGAAVQLDDDARGGDRKRAGRELRERVVL